MPQPNLASLQFGIDVREAVGWRRKRDFCFISDMLLVLLSCLSAPARRDRGGAGLSPQCMPLEQRSLLRRWGLCWGGGSAALGLGLLTRGLLETPRCVMCSEHLAVQNSWLANTLTRAQKLLQAQLPPEHNRHGSCRGWSLLPWLFSPKEGSPLPYGSEEERPAGPGRHGDLAAAQQEAGLGIALLLPEP